MMFATVVKMTRFTTILEQPATHNSLLPTLTNQRRKTCMERERWGMRYKLRWVTFSPGDRSEYGRLRHGIFPTPVAARNAATAEAAVPHIIHFKWIWSSYVTAVGNDRQRTKKDRESPLRDSVLHWCQEAMPHDHVPSTVRLSSRCHPPSICERQPNLTARQGEHITVSSNMRKHWSLDSPKGEWTSRILYHILPV